MKHKRHTPVAEGYSEGVEIIRKLRTTVQRLNQAQALADVCRTLRYRLRPIPACSSFTAGYRRIRAEPDEAVGVSRGILLRPERRRRAVCVLQERFRGSQRRA